MTTATRPIVFVLAIVLTVAVSTPADAAARRGLPVGLVQPPSPVDEVERHEISDVDVEQALSADEARRREGRPTPYRFAVPVALTMTPADAGTHEMLPDGSQLWRLRIASPGAVNLNVHFDRFALPRGAALWLYDPTGAVVQGPYTATDTNAEGGLWTAVVPGDEVVIELNQPADARPRADLRLASIQHGFRGFADHSAAVKQGTCNIDVVCPEGDGWRDQIRSVARITISGAYLCTGQLLNNTAEDETPYFLTAQHCVENASQASSVVAFWNFESPVCGQLAGGNLSQNQSGASLIALWEWRTGSDFALIQLDEVPDPTFNVYYAGWDASGGIPNASVGIHHPNGDEKAISFDNDPLTKTDYYGAGDHQWRVGQWEMGTTEGGSSGSCIFDAASGLCIGTLTAGAASCDNPSGFDIYGRMDAHWQGNGTSSGRLRDWLDPLATGALQLEGRNPGGGATTRIWFIPAAASAAGVGTSNWKTQLTAANTTGDTRLARVYFVERGEPWPGDLLSGPHLIPAGGALYLDDPLADRNPTSGVLYVLVDGDGVPVTSRTYNLATDGGTFGQGIPAILVDEAVPAQKLILPMVLSDPDRFRTNLGIVQASAGTFAVRVQLHGADGTVLATKGYSSQSAYLQINDVVDDLGFGSSVIEGAWISVQLIAGSPAYWTAYASIVDNATDDPTYILPVAN